MRAIDFFCGAGGVTCGFSQAGIEVLGGVDNDLSCRETYEKNNQVKFLHADIEKIELDSLKLKFEISQNDDDLIFIGCSPCQYYTNLKTDKSKSEKSKMLLDEFQEFVEYYRPGYIFIENVSGLDTKKDSPLQRFKTLIQKAGYTIADGVLNTKYFGIPQNRRRYVLLATRVNWKISLPKEERSTLVTVKDAIGDMNVYFPIEAGYKDDSKFMHWSAGLSKKNLLRMKQTKKNGGSRKDWAEDKDLQLDCYKNHNGHWDVYGRMRWDYVSPTITTRFNSFSNGRYGHPEQDRAISLREGATLQSFPTDYIFHSDSKSVIAKMIGNAVPPDFAKAIGSYLIGDEK